MLKFVRDIMHTGDEIPLAAVGTRMSDAIAEMTAKTFGCVGIVDREGRLVGIITDGDLRRHMEPDLLDLKVEAVMTQAEDGAARSARQRSARKSSIPRRSPR